MSSDQTVFFTFEIGLDGEINQKSINSSIPNQEFFIDKQIIHRLLYAAQKALVDEEVVGITATTDKYMLKITYSGANFKGQVTALPPTSNNE